MNSTNFAKNYADFYDNLTPASTKEEYAVYFDEYSSFEDPFQRVQGFESIHHIFVDMYEKLYIARFIVDEVISNDDVTYLRWTFHYARSSTHKMDSFIGVSRVTFSEDGKVKSHIDYWDAAQHVYEKVPLLGSILRFIKRKLHA